MHDLYLWRLLQAPTLRPEPLLPLLRELADLPLNHRLPFLGLLPRALKHSDPGLRAAAFAALADANGPLAFRYLVAALDDSEPSVRRAAVEALRRSSVYDGSRWIHALLHPNPEVRLAAVTGDNPFVPDWNLLHVLPDPDCAALVLPRLQGQVPPPPQLPLILDRAARGLLPAPLARRLVAAMFWPDLLHWLAHARRRGESKVREVVETADTPDAAARLASAAAQDEWDALLGLFWDEHEDAAGTPGGEVLERLFRLALGPASEPHRDRVLAAALVTTARCGLPGPWGAQVVAAFCPGVLGHAWLPLESRRAGIAALYRLGDRCPRRSDDEVRRLIDSDLCRRPSGGLDLWAAGGLLHLLTRHPYRTLQDWVGKERVITSFLEDVDGSAPFLCLRDESERGRNYLIREICQHNFADRPRLLARLALAVRSDGLDFLGHLDGRGACQVTEALLAITSPPAKPPTARRLKLLGDLLGKKIAAGHVATFLRAWLRDGAPEESLLGLQILGSVARALDARVLIPGIVGLEPEALRKCLTATAWCPGFPYEAETELARALAAHPDEECRRWAAPRLPLAEKAASPGRRGGGRRTGRLSRASAEQIAACPESELGEALLDCQPGLKVGLCTALARRPDPAEPRADVCLALLATHDPPEDVAEQFRRFGSEDEDFIARLDAEMLDTWRGEARLPLQGHAWLARWEEHARGAGERLATAYPGGIAEGLRAALGWAAPVLTRRLWAAVKFLAGIWRFRERERLAGLWDDALGDVLVGALCSPVADLAAQLLMRMRESAPPALLGRLRAAALPRMPEVPEGARHILRAWIDTTGLAPPPPAPTSAAPAICYATLREAATSTILDSLERWCRSANSVLALAAGRRLVELALGPTRLAALLRERPGPPHAVALAKLLRRSANLNLLTDAWAILRESEIPGEVRFWVGIGLGFYGSEKVLPRLLALACEPAPVPWFGQEHWDALIDLGASAHKLAVTLAVSSQPGAYTLAVSRLLDEPGRPEILAALRAFLEAGTDRTRDLRVQVARRLVGHLDVFPILFQEEGRTYPVTPRLFGSLSESMLDAAVTAAMMAGSATFNEEYLVTLLNDAAVDGDLRDTALRRLLLHATNSWVRQEAARQLQPTLTRDRLLRRVAATFAWGVRTARSLTGKLFGVEMIGGEDLGYTRFEQNKVYINPLPIVKGEMNGREIVEGLIVHELGHHLYHRGEEAQRVWQEASNEGLHPLLNLVSDEHLERNLRARDADHGDRLKRLCAYAFQHSQREVAVTTLLDSLQGRAFDVLTATAGSGDSGRAVPKGILGVARRWGCVVVDSGHVLYEVERAGLSFARFLRALRMGLGNRHHDPLVAEGLALFRGKFRRSTMPELMTIARRLREIFGWQTDILNALGQELVLHGEGGCEGISNEELQDAVRRALDPKKGERGVRSTHGAGGAGLNLRPDEQFYEIHDVQQVPYDPAAHAELARQVARPAAQLRRYFDRLGLTLEPQRMRVQGRSFDRSRAQALVLRGDPRVLVARQSRVHTDLFVGVVIDCSGSMGNGGRMHRAKLFGALLAEAVRGAPGIDLRLFGFTDRVIYDAGTAERCAAHGLYADGGNNDAAGLWHAAQAARASRRKAKLLVMISDGLPTECSVASLQALVARLTRKFKMCCAQVAVYPLEVVCFPHYVLLDEADLAASVRRFGNAIVRLVQKALRGG